MGIKIPFMFLNSVKKLEKNKNFCLKKQSKNPRDALRCYPRTAEDGKIDWNRSNIEIVRLINASTKPFSGAYCFYDNKKLIIWDAEIFIDDEIYLSQVGQVAFAEKDESVVVITGKGKLKINIVEFNGLINKPRKVIKSIRTRLK